MITKQLLLSTSKKVVVSALLPYVIIVPIIVIVHLILLSIWFYNSYEEHSKTFLSIVSVIGILLPILTYYLWALRKFVVKAYMIIHNNIIQLWLHPFCKNMADKVLNGELLGDINIKNAGVLVEWKNYVTEKIARLPSVLKWVSYQTFKKVSYSDEFAENIKLILKKDTSHIGNLLNTAIANQLINASSLIVPRTAIYLIPITCLFYIIIWFF